jgi:hypothetical protein
MSISKEKLYTLKQCAESNTGTKLKLDPKLLETVLAKCYASYSIVPPWGNVLLEMKDSENGKFFLLKERYGNWSKIFHDGNIEEMCEGEGEYCWFRGKTEIKTVGVYYLSVQSFLRRWSREN